ncbi:fungal-specific transcription factor domain-containing protein [Boeremia exigua]|uniref:fungal-specific transcription factor domain-containing protein n=1 Tax=Boeremia exigua TaxID=749465 RepID=UPI001E8EC7C1|nr:fungal-specific transcription factor domain-containing protein [Boeremia exigua]KAH6644375.1 fungal-specific transcription factor domain-containing protein [Boeremia exigua]
MAYANIHRKVAIARLDRGPPPPPKPHPAQNREDRVTRACKNCRKRKVKCSGEVPRCAICQTNNLSCVYEQARRDRLKEAIDLNHTFVCLFRDLSTRLNEEDKKKLQDVINAAEDDMINANSAAPSLISLGKRARKTSVSGSSDADHHAEKSGEAHVTASVGSNEDLDYLDEDLLRTRESRETGYVGQNSEVQWLRSVQRQSQNQEGEPYGLPYGPPGSSGHDVDQRFEALHQRRLESGPTPTRHVTDATFYLDSDNIELDIVVNPYELPDPEIAERLLECYLSTVHNSFPIVPSSFEDQVRRFTFSLKQNRVFRVPDRWRALLNLVFAIGAKYSHLIGYEWQGPDRDHLVYMTRASRLLGMNDVVALTSEPDLTLVQATAVFSLYFLVIGHVSRAWLTIGIAIRIAMSLGLHLRNEVPGADSSKKETLVRTWWSLHSIECLVSSITGRPPTIPIEDSTVPLPKGLKAESHPVTKRPSSNQDQLPPPEGKLRTSSSTGMDDYLSSTLNIAILTQKALSGLYAPRTAVQSWQEIQTRIKNLLQDLEDWSRLALNGSHAPGSEQLEREYMLLQMHYWSTKILITRPCLCRTERRIKNQSDASAIFNSEMAKACVASARALTALFPDRPDPKFVYMKAPWWNIVHIMMQCAAVLLLEVGYQSRHTKDDNTEITSDIQKLIVWLHAMGQNDPCADRAYTVLQRILTDVAPFLRSKAHELLEGIAEEDANAQSHSSFMPPLNHQNAGSDWAQGKVFDGSSESTGHQYYPQSSGRDYQNTSFSLDSYATTDSISLNDMRMPNTFGNPFINNWDEAMPLNGLLSMWSTGHSFGATGPEDVGDMYPHPSLDSQQHQHQHQEHQHQQLTSPPGTMGMHDPTFQQWRKE